MNAFLCQEANPCVTQRVNERFIGQLKTAQQFLVVLGIVLLTVVLIFESG